MGVYSRATRIMKSEANRPFGVLVDTRLPVKPALVLRDTVGPKFEAAYILAVANSFRAAFRNAEASEASE